MASNVSTKIAGILKGFSTKRALPCATTAVWTNILDVTFQITFIRKYFPAFVASVALFV